MALKNSKDIEKMLRGIMETVVEDVSNKIYKTLLDLIQETIYDEPSGKWYKRHGYNGGFIGAFKLEDLKKTSLKMAKEIVYDYASMSLSGNNGYSHGDKSSYIDRRKDLYWILNDYIWNREESEFGGAKGVRENVIGYLDVFDMTISNKIWMWVREAIKKTGAKI